MEKPSERIKFALEALIEAEQPNSEVKPNMGWFFLRDEETGQCFACLGGLAALKRWEIPLNEVENENDRERFIDEAEYPKPSDRNALTLYEISLDNARTGNLYLTFAQMGYDESEGERFDRDMPSYTNDPDEFKEALQVLISDLELAGY